MGPLSAPLARQPPPGHLFCRLAPNREAIHWPGSLQMAHLPSSLDSGDLSTPLLRPKPEPWLEAGGGEGGEG